ncbi:hypothetical protein CA13_03620 [Planctomycetes bacterium CA13]|uniref:Major facilitator superfamily (MFS) profile domain-containing protein n=1 Tax=Novipirellula herctigrandis TaxID=2527986 RepID=A0A5C5YVG0_9BACT|nr:hypothetical protein CA13_03620 [Planctomycetes bacterium CA13]
MDMLLGILAMAVIGAGIVGWLWITVMAFSEGETLWGVGCLIISPLCLIYGFLNFHELKIPFFMLLIGIVGRIGLGLLAMGLG